MTIADLQRRSRTRHSKQEEVWVSVGLVTELTIWTNYRKLELARRQKLIEQRKTVKGMNAKGESTYSIQYRIDNLNPIFLKRTNHVT